MNLTREMVADAIVAHFDIWIAQKQREDRGFNRSLLIDQINRWIGVPLGSPYCIASDLYAARLVCQAHGWKNPLPKIAGTQVFYDRVPAKYKRGRGELGKKGDIGILQDIADPAHGHGVLVREDEKPGSPLFETDEGNTNVAGSREGDGFYQAERSIGGSASKRFRGFVDICQWIIDENQPAQEAA